MGFINNNSCATQSPFTPNLFSLYSDNLLVSKSISDSLSSIKSFVSNGLSISKLSFKFSMYLDLSSISIFHSPIFFL